MTRVLITSGEEIPHAFGELRAARKKGLVRIREPANPRETFKKPWEKYTSTRMGESIVFAAPVSQAFPLHSCDILNVNAVNECASCVSVKQLFRP